MSRHNGVLPLDYQQKLAGMTPEAIAAEAALMRGSAKRPGTATACILRWAHNCLSGTADDAARGFNKLYIQAWEAEKQARAEGRSQRPSPADRPVVGGRRLRSRAPRPSFVH